MFNLMKILGTCNNIALDIMNETFMHCTVMLDLNDRDIAPIRSDLFAQ